MTLSVGLTSTINSGLLSNVRTTGAYALLSLAGKITLFLNR